MKSLLPILPFIAALSLTGCAKKTDVALVENSPETQAARPETRMKGTVVRTEFAELVRTSVALSPSSAAGYHSIAAAGSRVEAERSALRPQLTAETSLNSDGETIPIVRLSQLIYDGGRSKNRVALQRQEAHRTWLDELSGLSARSFAAVEAIIDFDRNERLATLARQNLERTSSLVANMQERFDAGAGSLADLLAGQGWQSNAETELAQTRTNVAQARAVWIEFIGAPPQSVPNIPHAPRLVQAAPEEMVARSPRMRSQTAISKVRAQELAVAKQSTKPTLSAILETDLDQGYFDNTVQARLGVNVPIYRGGVAKANIASAHSALEESLANVEVLRRELERSLSQALEETRSVKVRLTSAHRAVDLNTEALDAARGEFEIGRGTFRQILDALRELNIAQSRLIELKAEALRAEYAILAVTGDILDAVGIVQPVDPTL